MGNTAPRAPSTAEAGGDSMALGATAEPSDPCVAEWGYEAADPALLARLWGEPSLSFPER